MEHLGNSHPNIIQIYLVNQNQKWIYHLSKQQLVTQRCSEFFAPGSARPHGTVRHQVAGEFESDDGGENRFLYGYPAW